MPVLQTLSDVARSDNKWMRAAVAIIGCTAAIAELLSQTPLALGAAPVLFAATIMAVTLLSGWRWTAIAASAAAITALLYPGVHASTVALAAAVSVSCGEALRRGISPLLVWLVQLIIMAAPLWLAAGSASPLSLLAGASVQAGVNVAIATVVLLALPRRGVHFAVRCRSRLEHYVFAVMVGGTCVTAIGVLGWAHSAVPADTALRLVVLLMLVLLASGLLAMWFRIAIRRFRRDFLRAQLAGRDGRRYLRSNGRWPVELLECRAAVRRRATKLHRSDERSKRHLLELRRVCLHLREELTRRDDSNRKVASPLQVRNAEGEEIKTRYRALMEGHGDGFLFVDGKGVITAVSHSIADLLGFRPAELTGNPVSSLIPPDHVTPHPLDGGGAQPADARDAVESIVRVATGAGRRMAIQVQSFEVQGASHRLIWLREPGPAEARKPNRPADQVSDVFVATMSHELRTPLHGLIATLDMLRAGGTSNEEFQHQLSIAKSSARALLKIANDVLDVTRTKSNLFTLERQRFSMNTILREVVEEAGARAASLGLALSADIVGQLPPSFIGDPGRLKQILGNLVANALKFTVSGGVTLRVSHDGQRCTVDVRDTGEGIPADKHGCIFEPFVQLGSNAGRRAGGTGLGLPISRQLAEAMKGQLTLLQSDRNGSTFRLVLSLEASSEPPPEDDSQRIFTNPRGRILVVEDNPANRYVAEALLAGMDCPATIVEGGEEALTLLRERDFDLILMDCQMPGMDGYETTRRVRKLLDRRVPIIAMTASAMAEDRNHCLAAGMDDFLPKPFNRAALNAVLRKWLAPGSSTDADPAAELDARIGMHPDLDVGVFDELRESLQWKNEPLQRIRSSFASSVERTLPLLESPEGDRKVLLRHLHTLMGSSGMVGARQVEYLASQMQRAMSGGREGALDGAAGILRRAMQRYERAVERRLHMGADI